MTRRKLLAIVHFVALYRHYFYGQKFVITTDNAAFRWLLSFKDPQGQVAQQLGVFGTYNY